MDVQEKQYEELAGDPDHLQTMAQHYMSIANAIRSSVPALHAISDDDQNQSKSTDALKSTSKDVAGDIQKAESRYRITAQALLDYVPHLRQAKEDAHTAVVKIGHAQGDLDAANTALTKANSAVADLKPDASDDDTASKKQDQSTAKTNVSTAQSDLSTWQQKWEDAKNARDTAAAIARNKIVDVVQHHNNGLKNPTHHWWQSAWHWVASHAEAAWNASKSFIETVGNWAGIASIFLGWVPGLGEVLIGLALLGGAVKMLDDAFKGKWGAVFTDGLGLALDAFGGRAFEWAGKMVKLKSFGKLAKLESSLDQGAEDFMNAKKFKKAFGYSKTQVRQAIADGDISRLTHLGVTEKDLAEIRELRDLRGLQGLARDIRNPVKIELEHGQSYVNQVKAAGREFLHNPTDSVIKDIGRDGWNNLSKSERVLAVAVDLHGVGEKVNHIQTVVSGTRANLHGDHSGDYEGKLPATPEDAIKHYAKEHFAHEGGGEKGGA